MRTLTLLLALTATQAAAQTCTEPTGPIDPCTVGAWVGTSSIPEAMEAMMRAMPDNVRATFEDLASPVGMIIYEDGFFETFPMTAEGIADFEDNDGTVTTFELTGQTTTTVGYASPFGGTFDICFLPGGAGGLNGQMTVTAAGNTGTIPLLPPPAGGGFNPVITYTCSGDQMRQTVALPEPLGAITYDLNRVSTASFPFAMGGAP